MVGGKVSVSIARTVAIASNPPAAPSVCPVDPLVDDRYIFLAFSSPKAFLTANVSNLSL